MKYIFLLLTICSVGFSCRREDTYPDYQSLVGKWKLIYTTKHTYSTNIYDTIWPSENYELDFRKNPKVKMLKNGNCERSEKIYKCDDVVFYNTVPQARRYDIEMKNDRISFKAHNFDPVVDTFFFNSLYPFEDEEGVIYYNNYYIKE